jgi:hypothetical protein
MADPLSSLSAPALSLRLQGLAGEERAIQADFLLHLDEFDRRRSFLELGYPSLWEYCLRALHLREGAAARRIGAMRVLRRFPLLEGALRDGRLCLSTLSLLGQVLTAENLDDLVGRASFKTKAEVDTLVASVKPRSAPADGIRRLPTGPTVSLVSSDARGSELELGSGNLDVLPCSGKAQGPLLPTSLASALGPVSSALSRDPRCDDLAVPMIPSQAAPPPRPAEVRAVSGEQWSLRVTLDAEAKDALETLTMLLAHKNPKGDLAAVLKEALSCGIEKHGKRRGAVQPTVRRIARARETPAAATSAIAPAAAAPAPASVPAAAGAPPVSVPATKAVSAAPTRVSSSSGIPAEVRRRVWERDGGRCTFTAADGTLCGSRWMLELDHVIPRAVGGPSTVEGLRLRCRAHNLLHAEETFGREHMDLFRRRDPSAQEHALTPR